MEFGFNVFPAQILQLHSFLPNYRIGKKLIQKISITIIIQDIIHLPVFYLEHRVSEAGFCLRHQVMPTQLSPIDGVNLRTDTENSSVDCAQLSRRRLKSETEFSIRKVVF
jgi:hypothetical protein